MDLALTDEQQSLRAAVDRMLTKCSSPEQVRQAEPLGFDPRVWHELVEMGVPTMGVPGIGGAGLADMAVVARAAGAHLAAAPVVEVMVANRLLAATDREVDDAAVRTIAVRPARDHRFNLVPGAAVAAEVIGLIDQRLVVVDQPRGSASGPLNLGSAPLADVAVEVDVGGHPVRIVAEGDAAVAAFATALDEWRALTAQWLAGLGRAAFAIGVRYATDRRQFGVPIGSFQAVQHRLADLTTALDGATLLSDKAVWALATGDQMKAAFASMAFAAAGETAQQAASYALHLHGGYGFMEEYDIQLFFRRAKATCLVLGDPRRELQHLADELYGPAQDRG